MDQGLKLVILFHALKEHEEVLPVFILDPSCLKGSNSSSSRNAFLFNSLTELDQQIRSFHSKLIIRIGDPLKELQKLIKEINYDSLYFNKIYEKNEINQEKNIYHYFQEKNISVKIFNDSNIFSADQVLNSREKKLKNYKNYRTIWKKNYFSNELKPFNLKKSELLKFSKKDSFIRSLDEYKDFFFTEIAPEFNDKKIISKQNNHKKSELILNTELCFGKKSIRSFLKNIPKDPKISKKIIEEISKRNFYQQKYYESLEKTEEILSENNENWNEKYQHFLLWCQGKTGYPLIDAAINELVRTNWLEKKLRFLCSSFLIFRLNVPWQWGENFFSQKLFNADPFLNYYEWQETALEKDKNRDFVSESKKIDVRGIYIKKEISLLAGIPDFFIHEPYKMPATLQEKLNCIIGVDYPLPIIENREMRKSLIKIRRKF